MNRRQALELVYALWAVGLRAIAQHYPTRDAPAPWDHYCVVVGDGGLDGSPCVIY